MTKLLEKTYTTGTNKIAKLDAAMIDAMTQGDELSDPDYPGLRVRCGKVDANGKSTKTFFYRFRNKAGELKQLRIGAFGEWTLAAARKKRDAHRVTLDNGGDPQENKQTEKTAAKAVSTAKKQAAKDTVRHLTDLYLQKKVEPNRKKKGYNEARRLITSAIEGIETKPANGITRKQADAIIGEIAQRAPRVAQMTRTEMRAAWEYGINKELVAMNPFAGKDVGDIPKRAPKQQVLTGKQAGALLRWMREPNSYSRTVADALEITLRTGLRSGEVCGIRMNELDERNGVLWLDIPASRMKMGEPHSVPLVGRAREVVLSRKVEGATYLFPTRDGKKPIEQKVLGVEVYASSGRSTAAAYAHRRVCPVTGWAPHDLRRTARTLLGELGCPFEVGEAILAHALPGVAGIYNKAAYAPQKIEWLTKLGEYLDAIK
ncbi:site-specific integrase [soil metagenome]